MKPIETTALLADAGHGRAENTDLGPSGGIPRKAIALSLLHITCSGGLILFNRYVLQPDRFPFPITLTTLHMLGGFVMSFGLYKVAPQLYPTTGTLAFNSSKLELQANGGAVNPFEFVGLSSLHAVSVVTATVAYTFASSSCLQMVKEAVVVWVYLVSVLFGMENFALRNFLLTLILVPCAAITISGQAHFAWTGLTLQTQSSIAQATQTVWTGRLMVCDGGAHFDPMTMVLFTAPLAFVSLLPVNKAFWEPEIPEQMMSCWLLLLLSCCSAFAVQVVNNFAIHELSACGLSMVAVLRDLLLVLGTTLFFSANSLAVVQVTGFVGSVAIIGLYAMARRSTLPDGTAPLPQSMPP